MKMIIALLLISAFPMSAQIGMMREDTVTSGNWNEYHPALSRAPALGRWSDRVRVNFQRSN